MAGRQPHLPHPIKVAIWDPANALPYRENLDTTLTAMNGAQNQFGFRLERMSAPRSLWSVDRSSDAGVAFLNANRVAPQLERIRNKIGVDYLFCVTDLPLRDEATTALYLWPGDNGKVAIMSIWGFEPPLQGASFKAALANCIAVTLLEDLSGAHPRKNEPKFTVGYFNAERNVAHITGRQSITPKGLISAQEFTAIEKLLDLFSS